MCVEVCVAQEHLARAAELKEAECSATSAVSVVCLWAGVGVGVALRGRVQRPVRSDVFLHAAGEGRRCSPPPVPRAAPDGGTDWWPQGFRERQDTVDTLGNNVCELVGVIASRVSVLVCVQCECRRGVVSCQAFEVTARRCGVGRLSVPLPQVVLRGERAPA